MTIKIKKHVEQEIELGKKGDLVLVGTTHHGKQSYHFGKLEGVVKRRASGRHTSEEEFIKFYGNSYLLNSAEVIGVEVPRFFTYPGSRYLNTNIVDFAVNGLEEIIGHLDSTGNDLYKGHANMLRRISKKYSSERRK